MGMDCMGMGGSGNVKSHSQSSVICGSQFASTRNTAVSIGSSGRLVMLSTVTASVNPSDYSIDNWSQCARAVWTRQTSSRLLTTSWNSAVNK